MLENPNVEIIDITNEREKLTSTNSPKGVNLGGKYNFEAALAEDNVGAPTIHLRTSGGRVFLLKWDGSNVPEGAKVLGHEIALTQNGEVIDSKRQRIGTYDRLLKFGGLNRKSHVMIVYLFPDVSKLVTP